MKIQQQNSYNPAMKAVYFTKGQPLFNKAAKYANVAGREVKTTPMGTRYFEDTKITPYLKWRFEKIPFIKKISEKNEIFIQYFGEKKNDMNKGYFSYTRISIPNYDKYIVMDYEAFETHEKDPNVARIKMIQSIEEKKWFRATKFENGKSKEVIDPVKKVREEFEKENPFLAGFAKFGDAIEDGCLNVAKWCLNLVEKFKK